MHICNVLGAFAFIVSFSEFYDWRARKHASERQLFKKHLFTPSRKNMFKRLREAFPEALIFSEVPYGALLDNRKKNAKEKAKMALRFQGCCVNYVLCDENLTPFCLIKFDETPKERKKLKKMTSEEIFKEAGYQFVRYKTMPDVEKLRQDIQT